MSTAGGPKLAGIGPGGDSNLVLEMDAQVKQNFNAQRSRFKV
jgi:hypothetical protein